MKPKKHLGQHFLTAPAYARRIAESVPAEASDNVLEIGPGQGALSIFLYERFPSFHLVEIDSAAIEAVQKKLCIGGYTLHHADILKFDFARAGFPLHVVGNLPYVIGAHIIRKTLCYGNRILSCTFMVQREVAERIVAGPHTKRNGFLSVFCSFFGTPRLLFHVPPGAFFPRPNVDSSVFRIVIEKEIESKLPRERWEPFFELVSRGFRQRRKKLVNALAADGAEKETVRVALSSIHAEDVRAEDLDAAAWLELYRRL
ncbi:MAG: ribosomal RNA small subunit methyltransferase A [Chitinispirillaceae bacterium]|nr:ribosomal RNA small subunit methyltransferase A [Chitinispirillaceae bacterium]